MSDPAAKIVRMANQIAVEFENQGGDSALATWDHIWHFWSPSMRDALVAAAERDNGGLAPTAAAAASLLGTGRKPQPQSRATEFGVDTDGNTEGDAG